MTQPSNVDKLVSIDVARRFEALQDEIDLLKHEVKQTLVDLRGFMMESRTIFPQATVAARLAAPPNLPDSTKLETKLVHPPSVRPAPWPNHSLNRLPRAVEQVDSGFAVSDGLDTGMLGEVINWLATVKRRGLSLHQITPYVEAYERAGYLSPVVVKIILLSMADLDQWVEVPLDQKLSPDEYFECVREFHEIVCTKPCSSEPSWAIPKPELGEMNGTPATSELNGQILVPDREVAPQHTDEEPGDSRQVSGSPEEQTDQTS